MSGLVAGGYAWSVAPDPHDRNKILAHRHVVLKIEGNLVFIGASKKPSSLGAVTEIDYAKNLYFPSKEEAVVTWFSRTVRSVQDSIRELKEQVREREDRLYWLYGLDLSSLEERTHPDDYEPYQS